MNKFIKFIALAVTAVFTVVSCIPEVTETDYSWDNADERHNPANLINDPEDHCPSILFPSTNAARLNPQITISFPNTADILRASNKEDEIRKFLTFHTFENPDLANPLDTNWQDRGEASELSAPIPYKFVRTVGLNNIIVELEMDLPKKTQDVIPLDIKYSKLIAKINSQTYTYSNGFKLDLDLNGTGGEEFYDDLYLEKALTGAETWEWVAPGSRTWYFEIHDYLLTYTPVWASASSLTSDQQDIPAAHISIDGIGDTSSEAKATRKAFANQFASGFKLQKLDNGNWINSKTAEYDEIVASEWIFFKNVTFESQGVYRIKWEGSANLKTTGKYFGIEQKVVVIGGTQQYISASQVYSQTEAFTESIQFINPQNYVEITDGPKISVFSKDSANRKLILRVEFPIKGVGDSANPYIGLNALTADKFKGDDAVFKIIYSADNMEDYPDIKYHVVGIENAEFAKEGNLPDNITKNTDLNNVIYLTLDPREQFRSYGYLINDGLSYTGVSPRRVFGDGNNHLFGKYRLYEADSSLTENVWHDDEITFGVSEMKYYLNVKAGSTYRINWNGYYYGYSTKNLMINVSAEYLDGTPLFTNQLSGYATTQTFIARENTLVVITVTPSAVGSVGTFAIRYQVDHPIPLFSRVWTEGGITAGVTSIGYIISVSMGINYRIWWNDYDGNGTYNFDVSVTARYVGATSDIFLQIDAGYNTPRVITADRSGFILVTVQPRSAGNTGTFGITYTANDPTRPSH